MSYSTPDPKHGGGFWEHLRERIERELDTRTSDLSPETEQIQSAETVQVQSAGTGGKPPFDHLIKANDERWAALRAEDDELARYALQEVVADLDMLLDSAKAHLSGRAFDHKDHKYRGRIKKIVKDDLAARTVAALPLGEIAEFLDLPRDDVDTVIEQLRTRGAMEDTVLYTALAQIEQLRVQLRTIVETEDHALLDSLVSFLIKIAQALVIGVAANATATLVVGEQVVATVVVRAVVAGLVTLALQSAATTIREWRSEHNPSDVAREALANLTTELASVVAMTAALSTDPHEWPITRIRLLVKTCNAQQALIDVQWKHKSICWNVLGELALSLGQSSPIDGAEFQQKLLKLRAIQDKAPKR